METAVFFHSVTIIILSAGCLTPNWPLHIISLHLPYVAAQVLCLPSSCVQWLSAWHFSRLMYAGCYLSLPRHCISPSVWHIWQTLLPINAMVSPSLLSLYLQYAGGSTSAECGQVSGVCRSRIIFLLSSLDRLHEYYTCWVNSQEITWLFRLKRHHDGCKMLERHRRTKCWPTPSITHAEQMTQFSLSLFQRASLSVLPRIFNREESAPVGSHLHRCPSGRSCRG